jgi:hypothetical protein
MVSLYNIYPTLCFKKAYILNCFPRQQESMRKLLSSDSASKLLLSARDSYDWTLLMVAACANADRVTGFLLEHDQINLGARDRAGNTALDLAKKWGFEVEFSFLGYLGDPWKLSEMSSNDNLDRLHFQFSFFQSISSYIYYFYIS